MNPASNGTRIEGRSDEVHDVAEAKYAAFISYSHTDEKLADELRYGLHSFAKRWFELRGLRVFLDNFGVTTGAPVWQELQKALDQSQYLVLIASPASATRPWVKEEIEYWLANHSPDTLIIVRWEGEIAWDERAGDFDWAHTNALPQTLSHRYKGVPNYLDLKNVRRPVDRDDPELRDKIADLASRLRNQDKDLLKGRDVAEHRKLARLQRVAILTLVTLLGLAVAGGVVAVQQRDVARAQARLALSRQLASESAVWIGQKIDLGALLAVQAYRVDDTIQARHALLTALMANPALQRTTRLGAGYGAFGPHGSQIAVQGPTGVTVWGVSSGHQLGPTFGSETHPDLLPPTRSYQPDYQGVLSPGGHHLAVYTPRGNIQLWNLSPRRLLAEAPDPAQDFGGPAARPAQPEEPQLIYSPDGRYLVSTGWNGAYVFDAATLKLIAGPITIPGSATAPDVTVAAVSPDGRLLVLSGSSTDNVVFDTRTWRPVSDLTNYLGTEDLAFSPDGRQLAMLTNFGAKLYDVATPAGSRLPTVTGPVRIMDGRLNQYTLAWNTQGSMLATGGDDGTQVWNPATGKVLATLRVHPAGSRLDRVTGIAFDASGQHVVTVGADGVITWQLDRSDLERPLSADASALGTIGPPVFSGNGRLIATADDSHGIQLWNVAAGKPAGAAILPHGGTVQSVAFGAGSRWLAIAEQVGTAIWDIGDRRPISRPMTGFDHEVYDVAISPNGRYAAAAENPEVTVWNLATRRIAVEIPMPASSNDSALQVAIGLNGNTVAVPAGTTVQLWSISSRRRIATIPAGAPVNSVAFAPNGSFLAINTATAATRLWDLNGHHWRGAAMSDGPLTSDGLHDNPVAVSADSSLVASASGANDTVTLWDADSGSQIGVLPMPAPERIASRSAPNVNGLAFSPTGQTLAATTTAGRLSLWDLNVQHWVARACAIAGRELTTTEWQQFIGPPAAYQRACT